MMDYFRLTSIGDLPGSMILPNCWASCKVTSGSCNKRFLNFDDFSLCMTLSRISSFTTFLYSQYVVNLRNLFIIS